MKLIVNMIMGRFYRVPFVNCFLFCFCADYIVTPGVFNNLQYDGNLFWRIASQRESRAGPKCTGWGICEQKILLDYVVSLVIKPHEDVNSYSCLLFIGLFLFFLCHSNMHNDNHCSAVLWKINEKTRWFSVCFISLSAFVCVVCVCVREREREVLNDA